MGVLAPLLSPKWSSNGKREGAPWGGLLSVGAATLVLMGCVFMLAPPGSAGPSNRLRVRLHLDSGAQQATWEAQGEEGPVQDAVAALGAATLQQQPVPAGMQDAPSEAEVAAATAALQAAGDSDAQAGQQAAPGEQQSAEAEAAADRDGTATDPVAPQRQQQQEEQATEAGAEKRQQGTEPDTQQQQQADEPARDSSAAEQPAAADSDPRPPEGRQQTEGQPGAAPSDDEAAGSKAGEGQQASDPEGAGRRFALAVKDCDNVGQFGCLSGQANMELGTSGGRRQFRFPHFMIVGYQKCATTSLFHHLVDHPQIERPSNKEPEFFTRQCGYNAMRCVRSQERGYMRDILNFRRAASANFTRAAFEGSTHYGLEGRWLAMQLAEHFPWLKIVVTMREPISQAISMLNHQLDHKRFPDCYNREQDLVYDCIIEDLDFESRYARSLTPWVKSIPRPQLHVLQYENLTSDAGMAPALRDLKAFLEIDPALPSDDLGLHNFRRQRAGGHKAGWTMTRGQYEQLVDKARRNAVEVVEVVRQQGFADADAWLANWEAAWKKNLEEQCEPGTDGVCSILLT